MGDVRALLFTDVVDSTLIAERLGDTASAALWVAHDRAARDLLPRWHGHEIEKTDGLLVLFERADDAVGYALDYHAALARLPVPLKARAGLHVGPVSLRENSARDVALGAKPVEVEGLAKPIAARVMAVALGGQTLLTAEARQALGAARAPARIHLQSHGHWRFKGLAEPVELFEAGETGPDRPAAPFTPPPDAAKAYRVVRQHGLWLPARRIKHSLPAERDDFVGRHDTLVELARRFDAGARLISVLGMGGSGKTRVATRWAWNWLGDFPGGAWFCDVSQARSLDGVVHAVAQGVQVPLGRDDPVVQLGHAIAGRGACLLILDNFEQVSRHADATLGRWLDRAGEARFLVTSREVLGLTGEEALALPPLPPGDAAALFVRRAASAQADFSPNAQDEAAIEPLVRLLDGLPLAIELAAARVRVLSPSKLLARMSERFQLLASSGRRHDRQATLRATFDWSWDLLAPPERAALAQLSVFEGGFTLEAAEAVLDLAAFAAAPWPTDVLQSLVDKSFVRQLGNGRFDLLVSMQEYAAEHLRAPGRFGGSGPQAQATARSRHVAYFAGLGELRAVANGYADLDNLIAACRCACAAGEAEHATGALEGAWAALRLRGPFAAGVELAALVRTVASRPVALVARLEHVSGSAAHAAGRIDEAHSHLVAALANIREVGNKRAETSVLNELGDLLTNEGNVEEGRACLQEALALARQLGDRSLECAALNGLGTSNNDVGRTDDARAHYEAALVCARMAGDRRWEGGVLGNLGQVDAMQGRLDDAQRHFEAGLAVARELGDRRWEGNARCNLGLLHQVRGNLPEAQAHLEAALVAARELGHARLEGIALCNLGIVDENLGLLDSAQGRYEASIDVMRRLGERRNEGQFLNYLGRLHARRSRPDDARRCLAAGETLLLEVSDRFNLGVLLCTLAETEQLHGSPHAARAALERAEALAREVGADGESELGLSIVRVAKLLAGF